MTNTKQTHNKQLRFALGQFLDSSNELMEVDTKEPVQVSLAVTRYLIENKITFICTSKFDEVVFDLLGLKYQGRGIGINTNKNRIEFSKWFSNHIRSSS